MYDVPKTTLNGLAASHDVGIFNDFGGSRTPTPNTPLASVTVPAATAGSRFVPDEVGGLGGTRFITLATPITLSAGTKYFIIADNFQFAPGGADNYLNASPVNYIIGQDFTLNDGSVSYARGSTSLTDSNKALSSITLNLSLGPNFEYKVL